MYKVMFDMILYLSLQSEDLPTSEQETSPSPSSIIQPGTGPAQVNNNTSMNKKGTVPDEPCVESREETPVSTHI